MLYKKCMFIYILIILCGTNKILVGDKLSLKMYTVNVRVRNRFLVQNDF